jgi:hypothetical protein
MLGLVRKHPVLSAFVALCVVAGVILAFPLAPDDWPTWRKVGAGLLSGALAGYFVTLTRMMGAYSGSEDQLD